MTNEENAGYELFAVLVSLDDCSGSGEGGGGSGFFAWTIPLRWSPRSPAPSILPIFALKKSTSARSLDR
mgnify:CR=1 FL=1